MFGQKFLRGARASWLKFPFACLFLFVLGSVIGTQKILLALWSEILLASLGNHIKCQGSNLGLPLARQVPNPLYCHSGSHTVYLCFYLLWLWCLIFVDAFHLNAMESSSYIFLPTCLGTWYQDIIFILIWSVYMVLERVLNSFSCMQLKNIPSTIWQKGLLYTTLHHYQKLTYHIDIGIYHRILFHWSENLCLSQ